MDVVLFFLPALTAFLCFAIWGWYFYYLPSYPERKKKKFWGLKSTPKPEKVFQRFPSTLHSTQHTHTRSHNPISSTCHSSVHHSHPWNFKQTRVFQFPSFEFWDGITTDYGDDTQLCPLNPWNTYSPGSQQPILAPFRYYHHFQHTKSTC